MPGYILRSINLLNILLVAVAVASAQYVFSPPVVKTLRITPPAVKAAPVTENARKTKAEPAQSLIDYALIADQNLFHPDRKIPPEKVAAKPLPIPEFVLYGTLITDETGLAYMVDKKAPVSTPGRGNRTRVLKKGETLSGFVLKSVEPDRVVMVRDKEVMTVMLADPKDRGKETAAKTAAAVPSVPGAPASSTGSTPPNLGRRAITPHMNR